MDKKNKSKKRWVLRTFLIPLSIVIGIFVFLWLDYLPKPDEQLKMAQDLINKDKLIGRNIKICDDYFGKPNRINELTNGNYRKEFSAGREHIGGYFGLDHFEYYVIYIYYDESGTITDARISIDRYAN